MDVTTVLQLIIQEMRQTNCVLMLAVTRRQEDKKLEDKMDKKFVLHTLGFLMFCVFIMSQYQGSNQNIERQKETKRLMLPAASFPEVQIGEFILEAKELLKILETITRDY